MGSSETIKDRMVDGAPCDLECVPCSDEDLFWQFWGGEWVAPREDPEWTDQSRQGQLSPMGCVGCFHPENYKVHQLLDAIQSGHNVLMLGALGTPHLAIFSGIDPPLSKEEASYN